MNGPKYRYKPIATVAALSKHLGISERELISLGGEASRLAYPNKPEPKKSGGFRQTYRVDRRLKAVHEAVKLQIFRKVKWPTFLHGSIWDPALPRDHITDALEHAHGVHIVNLDVSKFFSSLSSEQVYRMWLSGFGFSPTVAKLLTDITTLDGRLYEGAATSPLIANMIFGKHEADLAEKFSKKSITYTRYVDDITLSSTTRIDGMMLGDCIRQVYGMLINKGLAPNRKKQKVYIGAGMGKIHSITARRGRVHYEKGRRKAIKLEAYNLVKEAAEHGTKGEAYAAKYRSVIGKLVMMRRLHPEEAQIELDKLIGVAPDS